MAVTMTSIRLDTDLADEAVKVLGAKSRTEAAHATTSSVAAGPGNLTLAAPTVYPHQAGTVVSTLPAAVEQACIYFAAADAPTRGATTTTIHAVGGGAQSSGGGARELIEEGELLIHGYRVTI